MTVVVAFLCTDGVVVAADSMITSKIGNVPFANQTGKKIYLLQNETISAYSGSPGLSARFRQIAENQLAHQASPQALEFPLQVTASLVQQFKATGISQTYDLSAVLAYPHGASFLCCMFELNMQPRLLDTHHFFAAQGSGSLQAEPFLKFITGIFCSNGQLPNVGLATFLATWVVDHVIQTCGGGVGGPICVAVLEREAATNQLRARELPTPEIDSHKQASADAAQALLTWRNNIQGGGAAATGATPPPQLQPPPPIPHPPAAAAAAQQKPKALWEPPYKKRLKNSTAQPPVFDPQNKD